MKSLRLCICGLAVGLMGATAQAQLEGNLLLRQAPPAAPYHSYINRIISATPNQSTGMGSLVSITGAGWNVSNIQTYMAGPLSNWYGHVNRAMLTVSRAVNGAPDPAHDPVGPSSGPGIVYSGIVGITTDSKVGLNFRLQANTSGVAELQGLVAGSYIFSLTAFDDGFGNALAITTNQDTGQDGFIRNTPGGFGWWWGSDSGTGLDWSTLTRVFSSNTPAHTDWAIGINGTVVPEPVTVLALAGGLATLLRRRKATS